MPAQAGTTPAAAPGLDPTLLQALVQLLLAERQDALTEKQDKEKAKQARETQRKINSQYNEAETKKRQELCTHKKGGKKGPKAGRLDYAVYFHTFIDATSVVKCQICSAKWKAGDTREHLVRRGKQIPNHTRIGWQDALEMLGNSTNTASASEIPLQATAVAGPAQDLSDPNVVEN